MKKFSYVIIAVGLVIAIASLSFSAISKDAILSKKPITQKDLQQSAIVTEKMMIDQAEQANMVTARGPQAGVAAIVAHREITEKPVGSSIAPPPDPNIILQGGDNCASATPIPVIPYSDAGTTVGYTNDYDEVCPYTGSTAPDVVYSYSPAVDTCIEISLCNSPTTDYDTKLYVYEDECVSPYYACNDDWSGCWFDAYVSALFQVRVYAGHTYYIVVDGYGTSAGNYTLTVNYDECPGAPPANDDCEDAEAIVPPYPASGTGTCIDATVDCPGVLDWAGVWYTIQLPYATNDITIEECGVSAEMNWTGIVLMDDCLCDNYILPSTYLWDPAGCPTGYGFHMEFWNVAGPGIMYWPAWIADANSVGIDFSYTVDVTEPGVCDVICPPNGILEGEPVCYDEYVDAYNGGCNSTPPVFSYINPLDTICGESGTYLYQGGQYRDTDWYEWVYTGPTMNLTFTTVAEFPLQTIIIDGTGGCTNYVILTYGTANPCDTLSLEYTIDAGTYWLWVGPSVFTGWPCPWEYVCWFTIEEPPPCIPDFSVAAPGTWTGSTCGAGNDCGLRPTEEIMYEVAIPTDGAWIFSLCGSDFDTYLFVGTTCCGQEIGYNDDYCGVQSQLTANITAGTYYVDIEAYSGCGNYVLNIYEAPPPPPNDNCEDAEAIVPPYPASGYGTCIDATVDCPALLNWTGVWYTIELPYGSNDITIEICGESEELYTSGIVLMNDCLCDDYILSNYYWWDEFGCPTGYGFTMEFWDVPGPGIIYWPAYCAGASGLGIDFSYTVDIPFYATPAFAVIPTSLEGQAAPGGSDTGVLTVSNVGEAGSILTFSAHATIDLLAGRNQPVNPLRTTGESNNNPDAALTNLSAPAKAPYTFEPNVPDPNIILQGGDVCASATVIAALPYTADGTTAGYTHDYDEVCPYTGSTAPDVVYVYTPVADTFIDIDLCLGQTDYDTKLYIYEDDCSPPYYACNDDACSAPYTYDSQLFGVEVNAGHDYYIIVDGYGSDYGNYTIEITEAEPPPPMPDCPEGALWSQAVHMPEDSWSFATSDLGSPGPYKVYDNYVDVYSPIEGISFWGLDLMYPWSECFEDPMVFEITFYEDDGGLPGDVVATYNPSISPVPNGYLYSGFECNEYTCGFDPPVSLPSGWVSIQGISEPANCWFMWGSSREPYDGHGYQWDGSSMTDYWYDCAFCLLGEFVAPWLTIDVTSGSILYGDPPIDITATMDAAELEEGTYTGSINFNTNDPQNPNPSVPVTFEVTAGGCDFVPGDANGDGNVMGNDVTYSVRYFKGLGDPPPDSCAYQGGWLYSGGDANGNCSYTGSDVTFLVAYFKGYNPAILWCPETPPAGGGATTIIRGNKAIVPKND